MQDLYEAFKDSGGPMSFDDEGLVNGKENHWSKRIIKEYDHWVVIPNFFPYDALSDVHNMLLPKRKFPNLSDASKDELVELEAIKPDLAETYDTILENLGSTRSIGAWFHFQLIKWKEGNLH